MTSYIAPLSKMLRNDRFVQVDPEIYRGCFSADEKKYTDAGIEVVQYFCEILTADVLIDLAKRNLRPAVFEELLAYSVKRPWLSLIVALGSRATLKDGHTYSPAITVFDGRALGLFDQGRHGRYGKIYGFLVVQA